MPLYLFYMAGFLFVGGCFVLQTSGADLRVVQEADASSVFSQVILGFFYFVATLLLISAGNTRHTLRRAWPVLVLPALAIVSMAWSPDPMLTLRRAIAYAGTILFGLSLATAYDLRDAVGLVVRGVTLALLLSCVLVVVQPEYGVHQASDAIQQAVHAGLWRGVFAHRNSLGFWAGTNLAMLLLFGNYGFANLALRAAAVVITVACLAGAHSGGGYMMTVLMLLFAAGLFSIKHQTPDARGLVIAFIVLLCVLGVLLQDDVVELVLTSLGKDKDLTGRTLIWYYILQIIT